MTYDPRYSDDLPQWVYRPRGWALQVMRVSIALFWLVVGLGLFIAMTAR